MRLGEATPGHDFLHLVRRRTRDRFRPNKTLAASARQLAGPRPHSGDFADASFLAQLQRSGLLPAVHVCPREKRGPRDLARKRMPLVRLRTAHTLSIEGIKKSRHSEIRVVPT